MGFEGAGVFEGRDGAGEAGLGFVDGVVEEEGGEVEGEGEVGFGGRGEAFDAFEAFARAAEFGEEEVVFFFVFVFVGNLEEKAMGQLVEALRIGGDVFGFAFP